MNFKEKHKKTTRKGKHRNIPEPNKLYLQLRKRYCISVPPNRSVSHCAPRSIIPGEYERQKATMKDPLTREPAIGCNVQKVQRKIRGNFRPTNWVFPRKRAWQVFARKRGGMEREKRGRVAVAAFIQKNRNRVPGGSEVKRKITCLRRGVTCRFIPLLHSRSLKTYLGTWPHRWASCGADFLRPANQPPSPTTSTSTTNTTKTKKIYTNTYPWSLHQHGESYFSFVL